MFSLIVPSYNESDNIDSLIHSVWETLDREAFDYEVIIVDDDSPDGTAERARRWSQRAPVRVLQRRGERGLASAVMAGWTEARGDVLGVMDCDGSHDVKILPSMVRAVQSRRVDLAVGSRYVPGGGVGNWPLFRQFVSRFAIALARPICPVKDSTSGYLVLNRRALRHTELEAAGFKVGLEVLVKGHYQNFVELPYVFSDRQAGQSKLDEKVVFHYLKQLLKLYWWRLSHTPTRQRVHPEDLKNWC